MNKILCDVYRSLKKDEAYLYVEQKKGLKELPEELLEIFGPAEKTLTLILTEEKKLARAEATKVMAEIEEKGFYLQMPPPRETYMLDLFCKKDKSDHEC
ncbi:YcgL domain-containing protein [Bacterioplanoides sp. SCSIO 12839]|uniref:YcgL domain-containing protein n=1 Tax=Bacterioplanoides sp. SCSIO 12839 TaxID=2829569 RepID=UPI00210654F0|nr:YcgL domain-containing protein [Bacterioplanoides sp. SCSIO 12839]UTW49741.1 YcgL domain-containing protein [Bacterioplanoides sp. SCSIO 12839]